MIQKDNTSLYIHEAKPSKSSFHSRDEAAEQRRIGRDQGEAYERALEHMSTKIADESFEQRAGDYIVTCHLQNAQGLYELVTGELKWHDPQDENVHIQISVQDVADGRFIPDLIVDVTVADEAGKVLGQHQHPFSWHPWLYYYGRNWSVPQEADYRLAVRIEPPAFCRYDKLQGGRYLVPVVVEFNGVHIQPGQQLSEF